MPWRNGTNPPGTAANGGFFHLVGAFDWEWCGATCAAYRNLRVSSGNHSLRSAAAVTSPGEGIRSRDSGLSFEAGEGDGGTRPGEGHGRADVVDRDLAAGDLQ
jgi:hypothetical protein